MPVALAAIGKAISEFARARLNVDISRKRESLHEIREVRTDTFPPCHAHTVMRRRWYAPWSHDAIFSHVTLDGEWHIEEL